MSIALRLRRRACIAVAARARPNLSSSGFRLLFGPAADSISARRIPARLKAKTDAFRFGAPERGCVNGILTIVPQDRIQATSAARAVISVLFLASRETNLDAAFGRRFFLPFRESAVPC
jgi:hypothetical protein